MAEITTASSNAPRKRVLVVEDEPSILGLFARALTSAGYDVFEASTVAGARDVLNSVRVDAVVTDIGLPGEAGTALLRQLQLEQPEVPVVLMTGAPEMDTAVEAVELGAVRYLRKPFGPQVLVGIVDEVVRSCTPSEGGGPTSRMRVGIARQRERLHGELARAIEGMWIAYQPIVSTRTREVVAYEALLRSREPALPHPGAVIDAAEMLGRIHELGRVVRARAPGPFEESTDDRLLFVNVHPTELVDDALYARDCPLARVASRVVLEITERASLEDVPDLATRLATLRSIGYRLAIDDLGAGHSGLAALETVRPEIVKLDMALVRDIQKNSVKEKVVRSIVSLARDLDTTIVAEGVETVEERDALVTLGCDYLQGFLFARPGRAFPVATW